MSSQPEVYWTWTPSHLSLWPKDLPQVVPSPIGDGETRAPFTIDKHLYNFVLRPEVPIIFASLYMLTVFYLNAYNRRNDYKPWPVSKSRAFGKFVVGHNVALALYSFATLLAMGRAIAHTLPDFNAENWNVRMADGLCKLHGPRGLGDAATYNTTINIWEVKNTAIHLTGSGVPDPTDVGRLWNEGLAFWGWMFYMSKFYEVLDTWIMLAKGKRSGTLQTYHHAGAMMCMWAGIRYMSPPIWMFVFVNSGIHALMYSYFTLSALGYKVPQGLKRALTMLQIGQFIWGASYAAAHLFIQYDIPITTPYQVAHAIERIASSATSVAESATSAVSKAIESPTGTTAFGALIKKLLLRAAGEEGVAERVGLGEQALLGLQQQAANAPNAANFEDKVRSWIEHRYETKYRTDWTRVNCIDTPGEAFAIYLNLLYLSPLTWLFLRFFSRAYTKRGRPRSASEALHEVALSARDAKRETQRSIEGAGERAEDELEKRTSQSQAELRKDVDKVRESWREDRLGSDIKNAASKAESNVKNAASKAESNVKNAASNAPDSVKNAASKAESNVKSAASQAERSVKNAASNAPDSVKNAASQAESNVKNAASQADRSAKNAASNAPDSVKNAASKAEGSVRNASSKAPDSVKNAASKAEGSVKNAASKADDTVHSYAEAVKEDIDSTDSAQSYTQAMKESIESNVSDSQEQTSTSTTSTSESRSESSSAWVRGGGGLFRRSWTGEDTELSEQRQDQVLQASQNVRPDPEDDTDAMGKSGAIVNQEDA